eukprot:746152-Hanusia_phi.AAC.8
MQLARRFGQEISIEVKPTHYSVWWMSDHGEFADLQAKVRGKMAQIHQAMQLKDGRKENPNVVQSVQEESYQPLGGRKDQTIPAEAKEAY